LSGKRKEEEGGKGGRKEEDRGMKKEGGRRRIEEGRRREEGPRSHPLPRCWRGFKKKNSVKFSGNILRGLSKYFWKCHRTSGGNLFKACRGLT
jgi:hypothetical protein